MLNRNSGIPLHVQLTNALGEQIATGTLPPHTKLPSERELCEEYGVSRTTVRKALSEMAHNGMVYTSMGKGTYVAESGLHEELRPLVSFTEDTRRRGLVASSKILDACIIPADDQLAVQLQLPRGAEVVRLHRLRLADDVPIAIQYTCVSHHLCPNILDFDLSQHSLYQIMRTYYGLDLAIAETKISAALATPQEAELLGMTLPAAVLISQQTTQLADETVIEFTRSVFRGDRYTLRTNLC